MTAEQYNEPTPRYYCFVEDCPGEHPSKWAICNRQGELSPVERAKTEEEK